MYIAASLDQRRADEQQQEKVGRAQRKNKPTSRPISQVAKAKAPSSKKIIMENPSIPPLQ
jgi:hypothetical protein